MSDGAATFSLRWDGPIAPVGTTLDLEGLERLEQPGVYACLYDYGRDRFMRVYVGMTRNFRQRMRSHVVATLGLTYWLTDDGGDYAFEPGVDPLFASADELARAHRLAVAEVRRMRWYHALDGSDPHIPWHIIEGVLIRHVKASEGERIRSYNERGGSLPEGELVVRNEGAEEIVGLLGETIAWPLGARAA